MVVYVFGILIKVSKISKSILVLIWRYFFWLQGLLHLELPKVSEVIFILRNEIDYIILYTFRLLCEASEITEVLIRFFLLVVVYFLEFSEVTETFVLNSCYLALYFYYVMQRGSSLR